MRDDDWKVMTTDGDLLEPDQVTFEPNGWLTLTWFEDESWHTFSQRRHLPPHAVGDVTEVPGDE